MPICMRMLGPHDRLQRPAANCAASPTRPVPVGHYFVSTARFLCATFLSKNVSQFCNLTKHQPYGRFYLTASNLSFAFATRKVHLLCERYCMLVPVTTYQQRTRTFLQFKTSRVLRIFLAPARWPDGNSLRSEHAVHLTVVTFATVVAGVSGYRPNVEASPHRRDFSTKNWWPDGT